MCPRLLILAVALALMCSGIALADGMLIPGLAPHIIPDEPYFTVKYHHVKCEVRDQIATTYVDQVFVNEGQREMEATYIFPLPKGAVVEKFTLHADGQEIQAQLLDKDQAQSIYEDIVRRRKDPALLTYAGEGAYQARIYPIPAGGERRIEIRYTELLSYDSGLVGYVYPLSPEKLSHRPIESVVFVADIHARQPIGSVYSPSHDVAVTKLNDRHVRVSYEEKNTLPDRDVFLYYNIAQDPFGLSLITYKESGQDGHFLLLAAPTVAQEPTEVVPKNICFVFDVSGSMSGEKIQQARDALTFCVNSLNPQDRFNIVAFSDSVQEFAEQLVPADAERITQAREFIKGFEARGGTDIDTALRVAMAKRVADHVNYICFMTDGEATVGETGTPQIVKNVDKYAAQIPGSTRLFVFGVGYDVNTKLLDTLAQSNGGLTTYVRPSESIEVKVSSFFSKIAQPLLTELAVDYGSAETYDCFPRQLPDLFHGSQIEMFGRYKQASAGRTTITLTGSTQQGSQSFQLSCNLPEAGGGTEYIASLWAARKIGYLLDQIRLHGESKELVDEIVKLSMEYGILTEYTAFLADEGRAVTAAEARDRAESSMRDSFAPAVGAAPVAQAQNTQAMQYQRAMAATNTYLDAEGKLQRIDNIQNVGQRGFVQRDGRWEDTRYQPDQKIALQVQAYSEAYFQLSRTFPQVNNQLAVGDKVLIMLNGQLIEIGEQGVARLTAEQLRALEAGTVAPEQARLPQQGPLAWLAQALLGILRMA